MNDTTTALYEVRVYPDTASWVAIPSDCHELTGTCERDRSLITQTPFLRAYVVAESPTDALARGKALLQARYGREVPA